VIPTNSVPAQIPVDSSTGLLDGSTDVSSTLSTDSTLSGALDASVPSGISLTDGSGNLTGWGWGAIAAGLGVFVWVAAS
jgi:hypothetical protein